jgi:MFS family permease
MYLMMPVTFTLLTRFPKLRPYSGPIGLLITVSSLILSSFATKVWQLIASQGVLCAIGSGLLFSPTTLYLDEWFVKRRGMAYGTIWAGKSVGGVAFPFLMSALLDRFGARVTLLSWSVTLVIITSPLLFFLKPRIKSSNVNERPRPLSWGFLKHSTFWMLELGNTIQSLGYLLPTTYLSSYAHTIGLSSMTGTILIALFALASIPGALVLGYLNDHITPTTTILISSLGSATSIFLFWGLAGSNSSGLGLLVGFVLLYGFFAGGFSSTYSGVFKEVKRGERESAGEVDPGLVMGLLLGGRGVGFVVGGPVSSGLFKGSWSTLGNLGYDTEYGAVIVVTGVTAVLGGWGWMWKTMRG